MEENYLRKVMATGMLIILLVLSFFLLKPILLSIIVALLLVFIFSPVYNLFYKVFKSKNISAFLISILLILLIVLPIWFLMPVIIDQSFKLFVASQQIDFIGALQQIFPSLFTSEEFTVEVGSILQAFITKVTNSLVNSLSQLILNFPTLFLQFTVVFFTFFFVLRDKNELLKYLKGIFPFSKDIEKRLFESSESITISVLYGQVIVGMLQGVIAGLGFFIFKVPNALLLTLLATLAGIFPIIGTAIIWIPVLFFLLVTGNNISAIGVGLFGIFSSTIDNIIRPLIISKRTNLHPALVLIGMIGGIFFFGVLGFILGPLILAYLLILLEVYRTKNNPQFLSKNKP